MSTVPLDLERKIAQRWAARFARSDLPSPAHEPKQQPCNASLPSGQSPPLEPEPAAHQQSSDEAHPLPPISTTVAGFVG